MLRPASATPLWTRGDEDLSDLFQVRRESRKAWSSRSRKKVHITGLELDPIHAVPNQPARWGSSLASGEGNVSGPTWNAPTPRTWMSSTGPVTTETRNGVSEGVFSERAYGTRSGRNLHDGPLILIVS